MYIKQISIDGFKSYAQRTVVDGFDPMFNAITGLNGSGKSNILDSICFVLGITNLNQVRAANLQDLVYKSGQAGVTKATVSIVFDNSDKSQSPVGYEQYPEITVTRQVVIGGRNKYLINGTNAQNTRVADLFRSVQLNVNNPHFLIMQGRITKVLNMKPPEILSMIEEAAGTKMYESKKQSALRTIEKKEAKLKEIDQLLAEEITPTLDKLKEDRASYLEYQRLQQEIEKLKRLAGAYEYVRLKESQGTTKNQIKAIREQVGGIQKIVEANREKCDQIKKEIAELEARAKRETSAKKGDSLEALEAELDERQREETVANAALEHKREALRNDEKKQRQLTKRLEDEKKALAAKIKELEKITTAIAECQQQANLDVQEFEAAQRRIQALATGLSANEEGGDDATLAKQLLDAKDELSRVETEHKQADKKLKRLRPELKKHQNNSGRAEADYVEARKDYDEGTKKIQQLEGRLAKIGYEEGSEENLRNERRQLAADIERLRRQIDDFEYSQPRLKFDYDDPTPGFDRSTVKGLVAKLIRLKDANTATAIEVAAGDRLYNIIVENEVVSKQLLQKGNLKQRVTLIPLNKISAQAIRPDVVRKAKSLVGDENCQLALSLIDYPQGLQKAMEYVFGNTLVCTNMDMAKQVTFHPDIMKRTVTLEGEIFDPQGTLTGGARKEKVSLLKRMQEAYTVQPELEAKRRRLAEIDNILKNIGNSANEWRMIKEQLSLERRKVETAKMKLQSTSHHQQLEEIRQMEEEIKATEETLARSADDQKKAQSRIAELEDRINNAAKYIEKEKKEAEQRLKETKKRADQSANALKQKEKGTETVKVEIQELEAAIEAYTSELSELAKTLEKTRQEITELTAALEAAREAVQEVEARVAEKREALRARSQEITNLQTEHDNLLKENRNAELQIKQLEQEEQKLEADGKEGAKKLDQMVNSYAWIRTDEKYFGQPGTAYDFVANDAKSAARHLHQAQERKEKLHRTVNLRAMTMLGKAEEQYETLMEKKRIVCNDKAKIEAVIQELDEKKRQTIEKAWEQVNRDFGSIFSTLLPGAHAKLEPPQGQSPLDGLEVRVGFGDVWKESLAELSGGQRSLVALSLILAMLLFKPAPIYILDEVDAALDLSHTQNIGQMLRTHFKHSQFIVVSLKDGMFNNANVLFRTKFVDGCSTVTRHVQHQ